MAHVVTLTNGTTTIDLAWTIQLGYTLMSFAPSRPNRQLARVSGFPFVDGNRTTASTLQDTSATCTVLMMAPNADDLDSLFQSLVKLLQQAQAWEERKVGAPVRLLFKHDGASFVSYRVVTGVPLMPQPTMTQDLTWLDQAADCHILAVEFTLTLAPLAHTEQLSSVLFLTPWQAGQESDRNIGTCTTIPGDMPAPIALQFRNTEMQEWGAVWLAVLGETPATDKGLGTPDITASEGEHRSETLTTAPADLFQTGGMVWEPSTTLPLRCVVRVRVPSGDPTLASLRFVLRLGTFGLSEQNGAWVRLPDITAEWLLLDLGTLRLPQSYLNRAALSPGIKVALTIEGMVDSGSLTVDADYMQVLPYHSFTRVAATVGEDKIFVYESVARADTFYWPEHVPQTYVMDLAEQHETDATRQGRIAGLDAGSEPIVWAEALQDDGTHDITAAGTLLVSTLPTLSIGLRGAMT